MLTVVPTKEQVQDQLKIFLAEHLKIDVSKVDGDTKLVEDLGIDSIDLMSVVMQAEKEYKINIADSELKDESLTLSQVTDRLHDLILAQQAAAQTAGVVNG